MPSKLHHELNKLRGTTEADGKIYTASIAALQDALTNTELAIKNLESEKIDHSSKINNALSKASQALTSANSSVKKTGDTMSGWLTTNLNTSGLKALSPSGIIIYDINNNIIAKLSDSGDSAGLKSNIIKELNLNTGVTIDGMLCKDGKIDGLDPSGVAAGADVTSANPPQAHGASVHTNRTRKIFYSNTHYTNGTQELRGVRLADAVDEYVSYYIKMPEDFSTWDKLNVIYSINNDGANQNAVINIEASYGANTETYNNHTNSKNTIGLNMTGFATQTIHTYTHTDINMPNLTKNDYILFVITRDGDHLGDDWVHDLVIMGIEIEYIADM